MTSSQTSGEGPRRPLSSFFLPPLYPILDPAFLLARHAQCEPLDAARAMLDAGARILQLRHKGPYTRQAYELAQALAELCKAHDGAQFAVNDRADIAALVGAAVLHVGQDDLPPAIVQPICPGAAIGLSTHNEAQFRAASADPAVSYVALGPIFGTASKENPDPVVGIEELARLAALKRHALVAIGGITLERAPSVWNAGADSIAVIGALVPDGATASDIFHATRAWCHAASMV